MGDEADAGERGMCRAVVEGHEDAEGLDGGDAAGEVLAGGEGFEEGVQFRVGGDHVVQLRMSVSRVTVLGVWQVSRRRYFEFVAHSSQTFVKRDLSHTRSPRNAARTPYSAGVTVDLCGIVSSSKVPGRTIFGMFSWSCPIMR